jgi:hypothetical protein
LNELFDYYGDAICSAISKHHPDAVAKINSGKGVINIIASDSGDDLLNIYINENLNVNNIVLSGNSIINNNTIKSVFDN